MAQVDFYVVASGGAEGAARVACRVAEKAWQRGLRVYLHAASQSEAQRLDELLWTFRQDSFVPHALAGADADEEAIVVGFDPDQGAGREVLVNVGAPLAVDTARFERIAEVVADDDASRASARERYAAYRERGHELRHHDVKP